MAGCRVEGTPANIEEMGGMTSLFVFGKGGGSARAWLHPEFCPVSLLRPGITRDSLLANLGKTDGGRRSPSRNARYKEDRNGTDEWQTRRGKKGAQEKRPAAGWRITEGVFGRGTRPRSFHSRFFSPS